MTAARLRVATWNIRSAIGPGPFPDRWWSRIDPERLRAIGHFVGGLDADVVALQEVAVVSRDGQLVDVAGDLARQLGMHLAFAAVRTFDVTDPERPSAGAGLFGNALLSRRPMTAVRTLGLPQAPADALIEPSGSGHPAAGIAWRDAPSSAREPRCLLMGTIGTLAIATAHFSHVGSGERLLQAAASVAALEDAGPALLLGDLNAAAGAPELAPLSDWTDAFGEPPGDVARVTTDDDMAIDHVLARGASVSEARVLREAGTLSDHYPVVATLEVE